MRNNSLTFEVYVFILYLGTRANKSLFLAGWVPGEERLMFK